MYRRVIEEQMGMYLKGGERKKCRGVMAICKRDDRYVINMAE